MDTSFKAAIPPIPYMANAVTKTSLAAGQSKTLGAATSALEAKPMAAPGARGSIGGAGDATTSRLAMRAQ